MPGSDVHEAEGSRPDVNDNRCRNVIASNGAVQPSRRALDASMRRFVVVVRTTTSMPDKS